MTTFKNKLPEESEIQINDMNTYLGISLTRTQERYNEFDAKDVKAKVLLECKHRTNNHNTYPDTIIGINKYLASKKKYPDWDFYVSFLFNDGLYYYKFDNNKTLEEQDITQTDKQYNKYITAGYVKKHINIPINKLTKVFQKNQPKPIVRTNLRRKTNNPFQAGVCLIKTG